MASILPIGFGLSGVFRTVWRLIAAGLAACLILAVGCGEPEPWKVGFVGCLTGRLSDLGVSGRDAAILAVEDINRAGGIKGRPVRLIVKDDQQNARAAVEADRELIGHGVVAIIGHMTSAMSLAALPTINSAKMVMISPTTSTNKLTGKDDYFFRVMPPNVSETDHLAKYAFQTTGVRRVAVVYDLNNRGYTEGWYGNFKSTFERLGGEIVLAKPFDSSRENDFVLIARQILEPNPQAIVTIAGAVDAAMLRQQFHRLGADVPVFASGWAMTEQFIQHGGRAVEGVAFSHLIDSNSQQDRWLDFTARFKKRFGYKPGFAAMHSYEAAMALFTALALEDSPGSLPRALVKIRSYQGLQTDFEIDRNGDAKRKRFLTVVKNGRFEVVK